MQICLRRRIEATLTIHTLTEIYLPDWLPRQEVPAGRYLDRTEHHAVQQVHNKGHSTDPWAVWVLPKATYCLEEEQKLVCL